MKLNRLYLARHLFLRELELRFDRPGRLDTGRYALDFLVGLNGSGKSTILRALAQIFLDLRADRMTDFDYEVEYDLQGRAGPYRVTITQKREEDGSPIRRMVVRSVEAIDSTPLYAEAAIDQNYLPEKVVIYTTGSETEWARLFTRVAETTTIQTAPEALLADPVQRNLVELPGHLPQPDSFTDTTEEEPPHLFIRTSCLPAVTLCGLLAHLAISPDHEERPLVEVLNSLGLKQLRGFSLRFRLHTALSPFETFQRLAPLATRHIRQGNDHLLVFDLSADDYDLPTTLLKEFGDSLELFKALDQLQNPALSGEPTLQKVSIFLEREMPIVEDSAFGERDTLTHMLMLAWLSDGEQSFLGRMAMLAMLETEDSLLLLDEPEVHFNDYWKREVVNLLDIIMQKHSNHLLITTHSSIVLSDVTEAQVTVMVRSADGWARQQFIRVPLLAVDPSEIMVNWFGTERSVGERSTRLLSEAVERGNQRELERLLKMVGPGYWRYRIEDRLEELRAASD